MSTKLHGATWLHSVTVFLLLLEGRKRAKTIADKTRSEVDHPDFSRIRCPFCQWKPKPAHRWICAPCDYPEFFENGCGACWNTFSTRGRCPGCSHQWRWTVCLSCGKWSLHQDWYESESKTLR